jgi:glutaredoxin
MLNAKTHTNFFEGRATDYAKSGVSGWEAAYNRIRSEANLKPKALAGIDPDADNRVVVYYKDGCPYCSLLKHELANHRITFDAVDLSDDEVRHTFYRNSGTQSVPQVYVTDTAYSSTSPSGTRLGGWSDISNSLDSLAETLHL